jgi:hypothetical protein
MQGCNVGKYTKTDARRFTYWKLAIANSGLEGSLIGN